MTQSPTPPTAEGLPFVAWLVIDRFGNASITSPEVDGAFPVYAQAQLDSLRSQNERLSRELEEAREALDSLYHALPDVLHHAAGERFRTTGKWLGQSARALRGSTTKVEYRDDDMAIVYAAMDGALAALKAGKDRP